MIGNSAIPRRNKSIKDAIKTKIPLVIPAKVCARKISNEPNGANNKSIIDPVTLAVIKAEDTLANAFCKTLIIIKPGIKNVM